MKKTFPLRPDGKHPDRVVDAVKHEIRKYVRRERRRELPEGGDFWDFDCRFGTDRESAASAHLAELTRLIDEVVRAQGAQCYIEILARPATRRARPPKAPGEDDIDAAPDASADAADGVTPA